MRDSAEVASDGLPQVWVLADDRVGHANQALGVAEALAMPFAVLQLRYNRLSRLPNLVLGATFRHLVKRCRPSPPWPDLVIAAGRRTVPAARAIKAWSEGRTHLVQCMWPGVSAPFDLIAVPEHDRPAPHANIISTVGALHRITAPRLAAAAVEWTPILGQLAPPRLAVLVGGATRRQNFTQADVDALSSRVRRLAEAVGASVMVATSPRTGRKLADHLDAVLQPDYGYRWGGGAILISAISRSQTSWLSLATPWRCAAKPAPQDDRFISMHHRTELQ